MTRHKVRIQSFCGKIRQKSTYMMKFTAAKHLILCFHVHINRIDHHDLRFLSGIDRLFYDLPGQNLFRCDPTAETGKFYGFLWKSVHRSKFCMRQSPTSARTF